MSEQREPTIKPAEVWLESAEDDLIAAGRDLQPPALRRLAFPHSQQAAEKALKAYWVWLGNRTVPRTHDLTKLVKQLVSGGGQTPPTEPVDFLESYPPDVRYPDVKPPSEEEATEALQMALEIMAFVRRAMNLQEPQ